MITTNLKLITRKPLPAVTEDLSPISKKNIMIMEERAALI
jgi:hypothetical protein